MSRHATPVAILSCGMTTAVGLTAPASCAAVRAGIAGFRATSFIALGGEPIPAAQVPLPGRLRGVHRLARLVAEPIRECLAAEPSARTEMIPLLLGVAETTRPGRPVDLDADVLPLVEQALGARFSGHSRLVPMGRVSGGVAIGEAVRLIGEGRFNHVLVAGVDSYVCEETMDQLEDAGRLLTERNSNGFVPGEAGAALLLGPDNGSSGVRVRALGFALEEATIDGDEPLRGEGLAAAYRQALTGAGLELHEVDYRIADVSGEQYWFKEAMFAFARNTRRRKEFQDFWCPADCIGETGAAVVPCMAGIVWWATRKAYAPGPLSLLQAGNDDGRRVAIVLEGRRLNG